MKGPNFDILNQFNLLNVTRQKLPKRCSYKKTCAKNIDEIDYRIAKQIFIFFTFRTSSYEFMI